MARLGPRAPLLVPLAHRRWVMDRFSKADLADLAWDYARQSIPLPAGRGDEPLTGDVVKALLHRRDVLLARARRG